MQCQDSDENMARVYFWEKWALPPENEEEDILNFYQIQEDATIREVIRTFSSRTIGRKLLFSDISPENTSVKKWINTIRDSYPDRKDDVVDDLLNTFRHSLYPRSKEKYRHIVGILLLNDTMLLFHGKKDPSLAEWDKKIHSVKLILHPKNVLRSVIIKNENGKIVFSAFEHSRKWSKGHAEFWRIKPEDVSWDSLGNIILTIEFDVFPYPVQLPMEPEHLDEMVKDNLITPTGSLKFGHLLGKITKAEIFRNSMEFINFYELYITQKQRLHEHREKFLELVPQNRDSALSDFEFEDKYKYEEDLEKIYEINPDGRSMIHDKVHPRYTICFFTKSIPGINPSNSLISRIHQSIFENYSMEIWHAGEETSSEPTTIGCLDIYNNMDINRDLVEFSINLLNIIQDVESKKTKYMLQNYFCNFWKMNIRNRHLGFIFDYMMEKIIVPELNFQFQSDGIYDKEDQIEFKSGDAVLQKPSRFVNDTLIPTIKKYITDGTLTRLCILYGIEDNGDIKPLYHLSNDKITSIEEITNKNFLNEKFQVKIYPIPYKKDGLVLAVFIIPKFKTNFGGENANIKAHAVQ